MAMWWTNPRSAFNSGFPFSHPDCRSGRTPRASDGSPEATSGQSASVSSAEVAPASRTEARITIAIDRGLSAPGYDFMK
jgi:hypothetical protein